MPGIDVPLLVIQGASDRYGSAEQVNAIVSKSSGHARPEIIDGCGHAPHLEAQPAVLELMSNFIAQINQF